MPSRDTVINVLLASPSDVNEERKATYAVVDELNRRLGRGLGIRLELIAFEKNIVPGVGEYPQAVINKQIGDDYDAIIAVFWSKVGSPTKDYGSGTIEELERAYSRYEKGDGVIDIMVYFKDEAIAPSKIVGSDIDAILKLKSYLSDKGVLYNEFKSTEDYEVVIRNALTALILKWNGYDGSAVEDSSGVDGGLLMGERAQSGDSLSIYSEENDDDYGVFDYLEIYMDSMESMTASWIAISGATSEFGDRIRKRSRDIDEVRFRNEPNAVRQIKALLNQSCLDMDMFSDVLETNVSISGKFREAAFSSMSKALSISSELETDREDVVKLEAAMVEIKTTAKTTTDKIVGFRNVVQSFPRATLRLNKAKRRTVAALEGVINEMNTTVGAIDSILQLIEEIKASKNI
ncbi:MAG: hypothetical protein Q7Q73_02320 [Verrucomicrobiota bacterium JB024]|nr:hypothetical protein [Verrucomicrobiota bacterium JB024]